MAEKNQGERIRPREPLTDAQLLMIISIGIFFAMYLAAMLTLGGGFLKPQQIFDLLNDNAYLIIISCSLTIVMISGGINISVGGVISLTVMSCALFLNGNGIENSFFKRRRRCDNGNFASETYRFQIKIGITHFNLPKSKNTALRIAKSLFFPNFFVIPCK